MFFPLSLFPFPFCSIKVLVSLSGVEPVFTFFMQIFVTLISFFTRKINKKSILVLFRVKIKCDLRVRGNSKGLTM